LFFTTYLNKEIVSYLGKINIISAAILQPGVQLVDQLLRENRDHELLKELREQAVRGDDYWTLQQGLLLYDKCLVVPDVGDLRVRLLDEVHRQPSTAHPGCTKTYQLMQPRYY
jgi:hypothetical protein